MRWMRLVSRRAQVHLRDRAQPFGALDQLRDPAGNFSEYYSDLDCIVDDALWKPGVFTDARALYAWGPAVPPSFLAPEDLAGLMTGAHAPG